MEDLLCTIMGALDIIAGIMIILSFGGNIISIFFGGIMILKGVISLI